MLLKFAINERSFQELASLDVLSQNSAMKSFVNTWREMGLLIKTDSLTDRDSFTSAFRKAPKSLQKTVKSLLIGGSGRKIVVRARHHDLTTCSTLSDIARYKSDLDVYLVDSADRNAYGISKNKFSSGGEPPESCVFKHFIHSQRLNEVREANASRDVDINEDTRHLYEEYVRDHVLCATHIHIIDRYCLTNQFESTDITPSGLENLLNWIFQDSPRAQVTIIAKKVGLPAEKIKNWVYALKPGDAPELVIHMLPDKAFSDRKHGRYIRLSAHDILGLDRGLQVFGGAFTIRPDELRFHFDKKGSKSALEQEFLEKYQKELQTLRI